MVFFIFFCKPSPLLFLSFFIFFVSDFFKMELDPITADFPSRTAREEDEEAPERATGGGLAPEPVAMVRSFPWLSLMAKSSEKRSERSQIGKQRHPGAHALSFSRSLHSTLKSQTVDP